MTKILICSPAGDKEGNKKFPESGTLAKFECLIRGLKSSCPVGTLILRDRRVRKVESAR